MQSGRKRLCKIQHEDSQPEETKRLRTIKAQKKAPAAFKDKGMTTNRGGDKKISNDKEAKRSR